jgi:hypothetical protein
MEPLRVQALREPQCRRRAVADLPLCNQRFVCLAKYALCGDGMPAINSIDPTLCATEAQSSVAPNSA